MSPRYVPLLLLLLVAPDAIGEEYPAPAMEKIREAVKLAEDARKQYHEKLELIRTRLTADLQRQLEAATKRGDLVGAMRIKKDLDRLKEEDFLTFMEEISGDSRQLQSIKEAWAGTWRVKVGDFESTWAVKPDGRVNEVGRWRIDLSRNKIRVTWSENVWDDINLPLSPKLTMGRNREGLKIVITKQK